MIVSDHDDLMPTPLEVRLFVAAIKRPLVAAVVLGLPFGLFTGGLGYAGIHPFQYLVVGDALATPQSRRGGLAVTPTVSRDSVF